MSDFIYTHGVSVSDDGKWILASQIDMTSEPQNVLYGVMNHRGETVIPFEYRYLQMSNHNDVLLFSASRDGLLMGVIDINNNTIIPFDYRRAYYSYYKGVIYVENYDYDNHGGGNLCRKNKKVGLFDVNGIKGNIHIPPQYDEIDVFPDYSSKKVYHRFRVTQKLSQSKLFGVVDNHNNIILPIQHQSIIYNVNFNGDEYFTVQKDDKYGVFDIDGNEIVPVQYDTYAEVYDLLKSY